jgi:hypothetical protein
VRERDPKWEMQRRGETDDDNETGVRPSDKNGNGVKRKEKVRQPDRGSRVMASGRLLFWVR